jgi:hypothetical protein
MRQHLANNMLLHHEADSIRKRIAAARAVSILLRLDHAVTDS